MSDGEQFTIDFEAESFGVEPPRLAEVAHKPHAIMETSPPIRGIAQAIVAAYPEVDDWSREMNDFIRRSMADPSPYGPRSERRLSRRQP